MNPRNKFGLILVQLKKKGQLLPTNTINQSIVIIFKVFGKKYDEREKKRRGKRRKGGKK